MERYLARFNRFFGRIAVDDDGRRVLLVIASDRSMVPVASSIFVGKVRKQKSDGGYL